MSIALTPGNALFEDRDGTIRVAGSRVPLDTVVYEFNQGATPEQIQDSFPSVSLHTIYGAIAFYLEHQVRHKIESRPEVAAFRERLRRRQAELLSSRT